MIFVHVFVSGTALTALLLPRVLISLLLAVAHPLSLLQHFGFVIIISNHPFPYPYPVSLIFTAYPLSLLQYYGLVIIIIAFVVKC